MRFGIAQTEITPPFPTPMAGYGARRDFFDGVNDPLTKARVPSTPKEMAWSSAKAEE